MKSTPRSKTASFIEQSGLAQDDSSVHDSFFTVQHTEDQESVCISNSGRALNNVQRREQLVQELKHSFDPISKDIISKQIEEFDQHIWQSRKTIKNFQTVNMKKSEVEFIKK